jgi:hypothetical protein
LRELAVFFDQHRGALGGVPEQVTVYLDRGYDSEATRER